MALQRSVDQRANDPKPAHVADQGPTDPETPKQHMDRVRSELPSDATVPPSHQPKVPTPNTVQRPPHATKR